MASDVPPDRVKRAVKAVLAAFRDSLDAETIQRERERVEFHVEQGHYAATLETPEGGAFKVGPAHVWGASLGTVQQNVDLPLERVPRHLRNSGLGECQLTIHADDGTPLLRGALKDDGNRQDGLNSICVAVVPEEECSP